MEIRVLRYFLMVVREESITKASEILQLVDKTEKELVEQVEGKISIGCGEIASVQLLPELFRSFREKYEFLRLDMKENWVALMRPDDALAKKEGITAKDLSAAPLILARRPLMPPLTASSVLAWKRSQPFSLAATKFIEFAKKHFSLSNSIT